MKEAKKQLCTCKVKESNIVYLNTVKLENHELDSLDEFYCTTCNSFWREP
jgi:hypothetical protein